MSVPIEDVLITKAVAKIVLKEARDQPLAMANVFSKLSDLGVNILMISQGNLRRGRADIGFVVNESQVFKILQVEEELKQLVDAKELVVDRKVALITFFGGKNIDKAHGVVAKIMDAFATVGVRTEMMAISGDAFSVIIREEMYDRAIEAIREELELEIE